MLGEKDAFLENTSQNVIIVKNTFFKEDNKVTEEEVVFLFHFFMCLFFLLFPRFPIDDFQFLPSKIWTIAHKDQNQYVT